MASNFKYTSLDYSSILTEINSRLNADPRYDNYKESSIVQTLVEVFSGAIDICNYYLQRRSEECYFSTAQLKSSVILLSRLLGYIVQRPIPASAKIKIKLSGDFSDKGVQAGTKIQIPYHSIFTYEGFNYILKKTMSITLTQDMVDAMENNGSAYESDFILLDDSNTDVEIVQGEIKEQIINGSTNSQVGQKFQLYKINDTEFSNIYGDEDYTPQTTRVWVGNTKETEYFVDRRSLVNWQNFSTATASDNKICVLRTAVTEDVELMFGDANYAAIGASVSATGATTTYDNVYIQYLSTKGSKGNKTGVVGKKINFGGLIYIENGVGGSFDITDQVDFYFKSNLIGGTDLEDIESIRINAPNIYYALDRLVTSKDYVSYLKTLTSPIIIRNALAWGEQEECEALNVRAISKLFNIVFYSCIGEMYQITESPYYVRTKNNGLDLVVLDNDFDENEIAERNYYTVYSQQQVVKQLKEYDTSAYFYKIVGNDIQTSATPSYLSTFNGTQTVKVLYKSTQDSTIGEADVDLTLFATTHFVSIFVAALQTQLRTIVDSRVSSPTLSATAFAGVTVSADESGTLDKIVIQNSFSDNCYVYRLSADDMSMLNALGLNKTNSVYYGTETKNLSDKIIDVTSKLKERSMIAVSNIYISPIIQNFNIKGKVYINPLADKESLRIQISDAIYKWLNTNADFNVSIYKSNIIDIINEYSDVNYVNLYFEPETLTPPDGQSSFYNNGSNEYLNTTIIPSTAYVFVKNTINTALNNFLSSATMVDPNKNNLNINILNNIVQTYDYTWNPSINERNFFTSFSNGVYSTLMINYATYTDIQNWINSNYFTKEMGLIHKDILKIIRYNMLDSSGNLAPEYNSRNQIIKGGYSIGHEIAKMNVQLTYEYKNN